MAMTSPRTSVSRATCGWSAFDAEHLFEGVHDLDEVGLVRHHLVDVLVGAGDLIQHAAILAADDALGLRFQVLRREGFLRGVAAHPAPGAMRAGLEALGRAGAADDVAARAHAARDDAELAAAGTDGAFARDPDRFAEMLFALAVVVVAVHRLLGRLELRQVAMQRIDHELHHLFAVGTCIVLRPADRLDVIGEVLRPFGEIGEVAIRQLQLRALRILASELDEVGADGVSDAAAARVEHHPGAVLLVEADLDEMVAAAKRAELVDPARLLADALLDAGVALQDALQPFVERLRRMSARVAILVALETDRHVAADLREHLAQGLLIQLIGGERQSPGDHAAADIDADCSGNDRLLRWNHGAHCRANTQMHVRHCRDMVMHDRQLRDVDELQPRGRFDLSGVHLYRHESFVDFGPDGHD